MRTAQTISRQAAAALNGGRSEDAIRLCEEAATTARANNDVLQLACTLRHTADITSKLGLHDLAALQITESIRIYREHASSNLLDLANAIRISALNQERCLLNAWNEAKDLYTASNVQAGVDEALHHIEHLSASHLQKETP